MRQAHGKLGLVLAFALACSLIGVAVGPPAGGTGVAHAQDATVEVDSTELWVDQSDSLDIWVRNFPDDGSGLGCYTVDIEYDPTRVRIDAISNGDAPFDAPIWNLYDGHVRITQFLSDMEGPEGDVRVADLDITCLAGTIDGEDTIFDLDIVTLCNTNGDLVAATAVDGVVTQYQALVTVSIDAPQEVAHCTEFVARVNISKVQGLDAFQFDLAYDPNVLEIVGDEGNTSQGVVPGGIDSETMRVLWGFWPHGTPGKVRVLGYVPLNGWPEDDGVTGSGYLVDIRFHAIGQPCTTTDLTFVFYEGEEEKWSPQLANTDAELIGPAAWFGTSIHIVEAKVEGQVTLQGRPAPPDDRWMLPITVALFEPGTSNVVAAYHLGTSNEGTFEIPFDQPLGTYDFGVKGLTTLSRLLEGVVIAGGNTLLDFGTLLGGDANHDDVVLGADYSLLFAWFGQLVPPAPPEVDFNGDDVVSGADYSLLFSNYGQAGEAPALPLPPP